MIIGRIAELAYEVSTKTKADVFFNYYPHTNSIMIRMDIDGWNEDVDGEYTTIWLDETDRLEMMINKLEGMLKK